MTEDKTQKKRVVSKARYIRHLFEKATLASVSGVCLLIGAVGLFTGGLGVIILLIMSCVFSPYTQPKEVPLILRALLACLGTASVSLIFLRLAQYAMEKGGKLAPVVPLTLHNANQLPPEESLVRASQQPAQKPETLLRAAQSEETPPEHLLRPG